MECTFFTNNPHHLTAKKREDAEPLDTLSNLTEPILEEIPTSDWSENI